MRARDVDLEKGLGSVWRPLGMGNGRFYGIGAGRLTSIDVRTGKIERIANHIRLHAYDSGRLYALLPSGGNGETRLRLFDLRRGAWRDVADLRFTVSRTQHMVLAPDHSGIRCPFTPDEVVVAWDRSSPAARAIAESLPILQQAKHVYVVSFVNEKPLPTELAGAEISKHLAQHGIETMLEMIDPDGQRVGVALERYLAARQANFLVMGAYGHSRISELILGGATRRVLSNPVVPTLISH